MFLENNEIYGWSNQAGGGGCPCQYSGCTDPIATNYDPTATTDDGSCTMPMVTCYTCSGNSLVGNNFSHNGSANGCPSGWSTNANQNCNVVGPNRNFTGGGYSNFNQQGFGGYNDQMWFNQRGSRPGGTSRVDELIGCKECRTSFDCAISRPEGTGESRCSQGCCVYTPMASTTDDRMNRFSGGRGQTRHWNPAKYYAKHLGVELPNSNNNFSGNGFTSY